MRTRVLLVLASACGACGGGGSRPPAAPWFVDRTRGLGLDFRYEAGDTGKFHLPEVMGAGVAMLDADGDGDLDLFFPDGNLDPVTGAASGGFADRLFRNESSSRFVDVSGSSGLSDGGYGMGVAVGDIDNDGDQDVLVTNLGGARLYENVGSGSFRDISAAAGVDVPGWSSSAAFLDYDRDGLLDLYVARYVAYDPEISCRVNAGRADYCSPRNFEAVCDVLLHNEGERRFRDVSAAAGITAARAPGLGVVCADLDDDGWVDVYVANDGAPNQLWINQRDGTFEDLAWQMGAAVNLAGHAEAGMGIVVADLDGDLTLDLFITHLVGESNKLYKNLGGKRGFQDATGSAGLASSSIPYTGFGAAAMDVELDGDLDLLVVNGRVTRSEPNPFSIAPPPWDRLAESKLFYVNDGKGRFTLDREHAGELATAVEVSRGVAVGDLDADGDLDVAIGNIESPARVFFNEAPRAGRWLIVRAVDPRYRRDALGARVVVAAGGRRFLRPIESSSSYLTSRDPRAHFGLGPVAAVESVEIAWPDGMRESFAVGCVDCAVELRRGEGRELK
ncbi:MAG: CRTAC1 family protein [Planctomycetota bacterium]